tara:strand:- start:82 stop:390 length:309 start_codon:yes stop_codon:yes gene_type:complete
MPSNYNPMSGSSDRGDIMIIGSIIGIIALIVVVVLLMTDKSGRNSSNKQDEDNQEGLSVNPIHKQLLKIKHQISRSKSRDGMTGNSDYTSGISKTSFKVSKY